MAGKLAGSSLVRQEGHPTGVNPLDPACGHDPPGGGIQPGTMVSGAVADEALSAPGPTGERTATASQRALVD